MANDGGPAYPVPPPIKSDDRMPGQFHYAEHGMTYHDVMVKEFMAHWFGQWFAQQNVSTAAFASALLGDEQLMREAIKRAKRLAELVVEMRHQ
jgi:hypothetical protein